MYLYILKQDFIYWEHEIVSLDKCWNQSFEKEQYWVSWEKPSLGLKPVIIFIIDQKEPFVSFVIATQIYCLSLILFY